MIISLIGDKAIKVSEAMAKHVDANLTRPTKVLKIKNHKGQEITITMSQVTGVWPDDVWEIMLHEKKGELQCSQGHWHNKGELLCGPKPEPTIDLSYIRDPRNIKAETKDRREKWLKILALNSKRISNAKLGSRPGLLKGLADLEQFEQTEKWPEYVAPPWGTSDALV